MDLEISENQAVDDRYSAIRHVRVNILNAARPRFNPASEKTTMIAYRSTRPFVACVQV